MSKYQQELRKRIFDVLGKNLGERFADNATRGDLGDAVLAVYHDDELVTAARRKQLLEAVRAGEDVQLSFDAITFRQAPSRMNRNFTRLRRGALRATAASGKNNPFLLDHQWGQVAARMGTVLKSKAVRSDNDDEVVFQQQVLVTKQQGVEGVLDGTIDRFSIGWIATGPVNCSLCGTEVFAECWHFPGEEVSLDDSGKEVAVCEWVFTSAELVEVSAVNVPAVVGTGIEEVRAAVASYAQAALPPAAPTTTKENKVDIEKLREALGLPATASEAEILAAASKAATDSARLGTLEATVAKMEADAELRRLEEQERQVEATIEQLKRDGKLPAKAGRVEEQLRKMAAADYDTFADYCKAMPVVVPVNQRQTKSDTDGPGNELGELGEAAVNLANPYLESVLSQLSGVRVGGKTIKVGMDDVKRHATPKEKGGTGMIRPPGVSLLDRSAYEGGSF